MISRDISTQNQPSGSSGMADRANHPFKGQGRLHQYAVTLSLQWQKMDAVLAEYIEGDSNPGRCRMCSGEPLAKRHVKTLESLIQRYLHYLSDQKGPGFSFKLDGNELAIINNCNISFSQKDSDFIRQYAATINNNGGGLADRSSAGDCPASSVAYFQASKSNEWMGGAKSAVNFCRGYGDYDDLAAGVQAKNEAFNKNLKSESPKSEEIRRALRCNPPSCIQYDAIKPAHTVTVSAEVVPKTLDEILEECNRYLKENAFSKSL